MNQGFWKKLKKPFFVLAPMIDVTDSPFRQIIAQCGKPDVFYTWFVSVDGLCSEGKNNILDRPNTFFTKEEKPIVVQLFGKDPKKFFKSAKILSKMGFDGIDINFGCPDKDILKQGAGAELIRNPELAKEIIRETKRGAGKIPVSVKTRIGYLKRDEMDDWIFGLLKEKPAAICIHGRTAKQGYGGESDWKAIACAAEIAKGSGTIIIGNGDVKDMEDGKRKALEFGIQGIMIGRAILGNPWIFNEKRKNFLKEEKFKMLLKHAELFEKAYENKKSFGNFRKYLKSYISGFLGSKELRMKLMEAKNSKEIKKIIK